MKRNLSEININKTNEFINMTQSQNQTPKPMKKLNPLTREQIQEIIENKEFDKFYRSEEVQKKYDLEKNEAIKNLKKKLENERRKNKHRKTRWVIRKNDYPYHLEKGLEHWIIWDLADYPVTNERNWEMTERDFKIYKLRGTSILRRLEYDNLWWTNPPQFRSVSDIPHIHLVKKK